MDALLPAALAAPGDGAYPAALARVRRRLRRRWIPLAAAGLLLALAFGWRLRQEPKAPAPLPPAAAAARELGYPDRPDLWHSGRGVSAYLAAGARARAGAEGLKLLAGEVWVESLVQARVETPLGRLTGTGSLWLALAPEPKQAGLLREAWAASGPRLSLAVASGSARWEGGGQAHALSAGEALSIEDGRTERRPWERAPAWVSQAKALGWVDLLADARASGAIQRNGSMLSVTSRSKTGWVASDFPMGSSYEMEIQARVVGQGTRGALAYPADGRFPLVDLAGEGWQTLRIVAAPGGTEVWVDGACARRFPPGALATAPLRAHPLSRAGLVIWHGGAVEIRAWRGRMLE